MEPPSGRVQGAVRPGRKRPGADKLSGGSERLIRIAFASATLAAAGAVLSYAYDVGADAAGTPTDVFLRGTALAPPLVLSAIVLATAWALIRMGPARTVGAILCGLAGTALVLGSTFNLATDLAAGRAAGVPVGLTIVAAALHGIFGLALVVDSVSALRPRSVRGRAG